MRPTLRSKGFAAHHAGAALAPYAFERAMAGPTQIELDLMFCGVCHSDLHMVDNDFGIGLYPMVPGHEMVGRVTQAGDRVTRFRAGDIAAIGCFIDSCRTCGACQEQLEQYCDTYPTPSFSACHRGTMDPVFGGFSNNYVVDEHFALRVPPTLTPAGAAPLLCGGITSFSALRHWQVGPGRRVGIVGLGGLGHLAIKFARAFGAHVVALTSSADKLDDAVRLGSHQAVLTSDALALAGLADSLDLIVDTVSADHDIDSLLALLKRGGTLCLLGMPAQPISFVSMALGSRRRNIAGSGVGGLAETQEMLDFCGVHGIEADVEILPVATINAAFDRLRRNDVKYRFVLDLQSLHGSTS